VADIAVHQEIATPDIWSRVSSRTTISTRRYLDKAATPHKTNTKPAEGTKTC